MFKSNGNSRPGAGGRSSAAIIDVVQRRQADRLAKGAFIVVALVVTAVGTVIASTFTGWTLTGWLVAALIGAVAGLVTGAVVGLVVLIWPVLRMIWWWTGETALLGLLLAAYLGLSAVLPWWGAATVLVLAVAGPLLIGAVRRRVFAWAWCAVSRHRLRTCFATFIRVNRYGSLPLILWARPTPAGERVWVVLRPGLSLEDLTTEGGLARMAVGCWANEVRITRAGRRFAPLLRVDITRRNPLAETITSPLTALLGNHDHDHDPAEAIVVGAPVLFDPDKLDLPGVNEPDITGASGAKSQPRPVPKPRPAATSNRPAEPAIITRTGEDLSDWV